MSLDQELLYISTYITTKWSVNEYEASGFFFQEIRDGESVDDLTNYWLVTNRHVLYAKDDKGAKHLVDELTFRVRCEDKNTTKVVWFEKTLTQNQLLSKAKVLSDNSIDVAMIDVLEQINEIITGTPNTYTLYLSPIVSPQLYQHKRLPISVCDDVVAIGYPKGYYDEVNLFPIIKNGTIASQWKANFKGCRAFVIDAKLFPGSSGSLVLTKPANEDMNEEGFLVYHKEKIYYCLGIYSGAPYKLVRYIDKDGNIVETQDFFDIGLVWYADLITETIQSGVAPVLNYR